jgi:uncharacterized phage protein (TIGR02218 family)
MPKDISAGYATHLAQDSTERCLMMRLDLRDGTTIGLTDHDRNIIFDLEDGNGSAIYRSNLAMLPTQLELSLGTTVDDIDVTGSIDGTFFTQPLLIGGYYNHATVRLFEVVWSDLSLGALPYLKGVVAKVGFEESEFKLIVQSEFTKLAQMMGRTVSPFCDAQYGDARCGAVVPTVAATVVDATVRAMEVTFSGSYADDYFNKGTVEFTSGVLNGTHRKEIFKWNDDGTLALWNRLAATPSPGDTLLIRRGCGNTIQDCLERENTINFRGFPFVPGRDRFMQMPNPQGGNVSSGFVGQRV